MRLTPTPLLRRFAVSLLLGATLAAPIPLFAGAQDYTQLSASVRASLQRSVADQAPLHGAFADSSQGRVWLSEMSRRLEKRLPNPQERVDFLNAVHYEAMRAGLDPHLVLGLIQVESAFRKYAVSTAGARGYMQIMPFWVTLIGETNHNLFSLRTNLRYGCTILRHYLDIEKGDLYRALGRYNGSLGLPDYPNLVLAAWKGNWSGPSQPALDTAQDRAAAPRLARN